jgi:hypothetical protein
MWYYNNIGITVTALKEGDEQIIVELQPLDAGTIYQTFGWVNEHITLQCLIVGVDDKASIKALINDGTAYTLSGAGINFGTYYVSKATFEWLTSWKQTFRSDKNAEDLIFKCSLELAKA